MNTKALWVVSARSKILSGVCSIAMDDSEFVLSISLVPASNLEEAISQLKEKYTADYLEVQDIFSAMLYRAEEWIDNVKVTQGKDIEGEPYSIIGDANLAIATQTMQSLFWGKGFDVTWNHRITEVYIDV